MTFGTLWYPCHCCLGDPIVLHLEDVASQLEPPVDMELVHATPSEHLFVGDLIAISDFKALGEGTSAGRRRASCRCLLMPSGSHWSSLFSVLQWR